MEPDYVFCPRCEARVTIPPEWLSPTIPPMIPDLPLPILLQSVGHVCNEQHVLGNVMSALSKLMC